MKRHSAIKIEIAQVTRSDNTHRNLCANAVWWFGSREKETVGERESARKRDQERDCEWICGRFE